MALIVKKRNIDYLVNPSTSVDHVVMDACMAMGLSHTSEISCEFWKNEKDNGDTYYIMKIKVPIKKGESPTRTIVKQVNDVDSLIGQPVQYYPNGKPVYLMAPAPTPIEYNYDEEIMYDEA